MTTPKTHRNTTPAKTHTSRQHSVDHGATKRKAAASLASLDPYGPPNKGPPTRWAQQQAAADLAAGYNVTVSRDNPNSVTSSELDYSHGTATNGGSTTTREEFLSTRARQYDDQARLEEYLHTMHGQS